MTNPALAAVFQRTRSGFILNGHEDPPEPGRASVSTNPFRFHPERSRSVREIGARVGFNEPVQVSS